MLYYGLMRLQIFKSLILEKGETCTMKTRHIFWRVGKVTLALTVIIGMLTAAYLPQLAVKAAKADQTNGSALLLNEKFFYMKDGSLGTLSGWRVDATGGSFSQVSGAGVLLKDTSKEAGIQLQKEFIQQTGNVVTAEIVYSRTGTLSTTFMLLNGERPVVKVGTLGKYVGYCASDGSFVKLWEYDQKSNLKLVLDLSKYTFDIYSAGILMAKGLPFFSKQNTIDSVLFSTSAEEVGNAQISNVRVYTGYAVNDTFTSSFENSLPTYWETTGAGKAATLSQTAHGATDAMVLRLTNADNGTTSLTRSFDKVKEKTVVQFLTMNKTVGNGTAIQLLNGTTAVAEIAVKDNVWSYKDGNTYKAMSYIGSNGKTFQVSFKGNMWFSFRFVVDPVTGKADLYANYKLIASGLSIPKGGLDALRFTTAEGADADIWLEDVEVFAFNELASDYVEKPRVPEKTTDTLIGFQSCNINITGQHVGWEAVMSQPAAEPLLGYFEESNSEVWDWYIKYQVEHGADFMLWCWNENYHSNFMDPLVSQLYAYYFEAYCYSEYSNYLKFALQVGGASGHNFDNYVNNLIPFWIQYYFTDPRYQLIDNRPIIGFIDWWELEKDLGEAKTKEFLAILDEECRKAGFDGVYTLCQNQAADDALRLGFDAAYSYNGYQNWEDSKAYNESSYNKLKNSDTDWIPTLSVGWSPECWDQKDKIGVQNNRMDPNDFDKFVKWMKTFSDSMPKDSLSSKMILVDNWNEIAEGHAIQPSKTYGFAYLESIADTFTTVTDMKSLRVIPTQTQLSRLNTQFPKTWNGMKWDFDFGENVTQFWLPGGGTWDFRADSMGHLQGVVAAESGNDGYIEVLDGQHIDAAADSIVLSIKNTGDMDSLKVYFKTDTSTEFSEDKSFHIALRQEDEYYSTYVIDASANKKWKGTITQLRLQFLVPTGGAGGSFYIDYIHLLKECNLEPTPLAGKTIEKLRLAYSYEFLEPADYYNTPVYQDFTNTANAGIVATISGRVSGRAVEGYTVRLDAAQPIKLTSGGFTLKNVALGKHTLYVYDDEGLLVSRRQFQVKLGNKELYSDGVLTITADGKAPLLVVTLSGLPSGVTVPNMPSTSITTSTTTISSSTNSTNDATSTENTNTASEVITSSTTISSELSAISNSVSPWIFIGIGALLVLVGVVIVVLVIIKRKK